jgi:hypothetical protein
MAAIVCVFRWVGRSAVKKLPFVLATWRSQLWLSTLRWCRFHWVQVQFFQNAFIPSTA